MSDYQGNIIIKNPATPTGPTATGRAPGMWKLNEVAYWIKQGVWPNANIVPDPYFPNVSLLLSTTALSNANNNLFVDSSGAFNPISRNGNTTQGSFTPYSTNWSNYFNGSSSYLQTTAVNISSGDFTVEAWVYLNAMPTSDNWPGSYSNWMEIIGVGSASLGDGWQFRIGQTVLAFGTNGDTTAVSATHSMVVGQWYHLAVTRSGNVYTLYRNGTSIGSATYTANAPGTGAYTWVGTETNQGAYLNGYISNARVVAGSVVYTSNFTPPTSALTAISGTSLLTCQSNRFRDASSNNYTITIGGNPSVQDFNPFSPAYPGAVYNQSDITNWSGYFDGSGDYLTSPDNAAVQFGSGDFTIEMWVYFSTTSGTQVLLGSRANTGVFAPYQFYYNGGVLYLYGSTNGSSWNIFSGLTVIPSVAAGQWYHVAVVRSGSNFSTYSNGVRQSNTTVSGSLLLSSAPVTIGADASGASPYTGYISNLRMVKGTAVYDPSQSTITVPTTNLTAISGTSLLTLQNAAFTDNSTNNFVITPFGNTTVTGNSPFNTVGYWSNYFDGSGDWISTPTVTALQMSGDFTWEAWVYPLSLPGGGVFKTLWSQRATLSDYGGPLVAIDSAGNLQLYIANNSASGWGVSGFDTNLDISLNTWQHIALVKNGTTVTLYKNGVAGSSTTHSTAVGTSGNTAAMAGSADGGQAVDGYMSNFRIVKGTAVYTSNFTVPTTPLTAITNTQLLTCQNGRFIDNSTNAFTITRNGDVSVQSFDPFYTSTIASNGGSMYFDGSGDYLETGTTNLFTLSSGNWTVQGWYYSAPYTAANQVLCSIGVSGDNLVVATIGSNGYLYYILNNGVVISTTTAAAAGTWAYFALVKSGSTTTLYLNGVSIGTTTSVPNATSKKLRLGVAYDGTSPLNGYISNFRILTGTADTAVPTTPVTPTASTSFLLNGMNAGIYDATTINDMETVGNAQVSTAVSKFGGSSVYFDGSGDYLNSPNTLSAIQGSTAYTLEAWIYPTSVSGRDFCIYETRGGSGWVWFINSTGYLQVFDSSAGLQTASTTQLSANQWYHVALVRQSGSSTNTYYVNGVAAGTFTRSSFASATQVRIGARNDAAEAFVGYMDDLRVTNGVARYTSNFTPPTQAFPTY